MLRITALAAVLLVAGALPVMAQAACSAPVAPAKVDGNTVTKDQLLAGIKDAKAFIAASDTYQDCLQADLKSQQDQAAADKKPLDPAISAGIVAKVNDNQAQKQAVGDSINAAVGDFKKAHPN
jgi:hypothetical protein